jgi:hypothetical protein
MNIFVLDRNPVLSAKYHCDRHMKMILESAQMLSTAINLTTKQANLSLYKTTHSNHPCSIWARETRQNFEWLMELALALGEENIKRYGKPHKSIEVVKIAREYVSCFPDKGLTPFAQAMPDDYKNGDPVVAYRTFYKKDKIRFAKWKLETPFWVKEETWE